MDRITRAWIAGSIGCIAKSGVNAVTNRLGLMGMRNSTVGTDLVLGKTMMKRHGMMQWLVGELASAQLGGIWGTVMSLMPPPKGKYTWIARAFQFGSIAWMVDMAMGARAIPRAVQGDVTPRDAFIWWSQHIIFGLTTSYLLDVNPDAGADAMRFLRRVRLRRAADAQLSSAGTGHQPDDQQLWTARRLTTLPE